MNLTNIKEHLKNYLVNSFGLDQETLTDELPLFTNNILNSLDVIQIIVFIEKQFNIKVPSFMVSYETFDSVENISQFIATRLTT